MASRQEAERVKSAHRARLMLTPSAFAVGIETSSDGRDFEVVVYLETTAPEAADERIEGVRVVYRRTARPRFQ